MGGRPYCGDSGRIERVQSGDDVDGRGDNRGIGMDEKTDDCAELSPPRSKAVRAQREGSLIVGLANTRVFARALLPGSPSASIVVECRDHAVELIAREWES